jgi:hypothetical protein
MNSRRMPIEATKAKAVCPGVLADMENQAIFN